MYQKLIHQNHSSHLIPETTKIAFNMFKNVFWTISASLIKFCPEKVHQDSPCPQSLTLESWRTGWFLRPLKLLSICSKMYSELFLQVSSSFAQKKSIKTLHVLEVCPGVLEDRMVPEATKIAFNMFKNVFRTISASFIKFCPEKVHQDSPCPRSLTLESWRTGWFLRPLKLLLICSKMFSELFLQVSSSFTIEKSIKTLYVL